MLYLNKQLINTPLLSTDPNLTFMGDKLVISTDGIEDTYYLFHEVRQTFRPETVLEEGDNYVEKDVPYEVTYALAVTVPSPATYESVVDAVERKVFNLKSDSESISFNASLARKSRINPDDSEVREHDDFMNSVLQEVRAYFKPHDPRVKSTR